MTILVKDGKFIITRPNGGGTLFNADDKLLHITDTFNGSRLIPDYYAGAAGGSGVGTKIDTTYYDIGAVNQFATQVIGNVKFVLTGPGNGLAYNRWHTLMGGTIVWVMDGAPSITSAGRETNGGLAQFVTYHFEIAAGRCRLVRNLAIGTGFLYGVQAHTIQYKLRCGAWV